MPAKSPWFVITSVQQFSGFLWFEDRKEISFYFRNEVSDTSRERMAKSWQL